MPKSRWSVRAILMGGNVLLVVAAVLAVVAAGSSQLRRLADEQATARVSLAGVSAAGIVEHARTQLVASARLLSTRPPLARLLQLEQDDELARFLTAYRESTGLSGCGLIRGRSLIATAGDGVPWAEILAARELLPPGAVLRAGSGKHLLLAASAPLHEDPATLAVAVALLDDAFSDSLSRQVGLPVLILNRQAALERSAATDAALDLRMRALDSESEVAGRIGDSGAYAAVQPLYGADGSLAGLIETTLPPGGVAAPAARFVRSLLVVALLVAGLAVVFSLLLGRRLVGPLEELMAASARIGRGDLATPVPGRDSTEIGGLAGSMEDMRARLMELTTELRRRQSQAEAVVAGIVEGVFAVDRERIIRYANPQVAGLLGLSAEQIVGRFCGDVLQPRPEGGMRPCEDRCPILHARFRGSTRAVEYLNVGGGTRTVVITSAAPENADESMQFQVIRDETDTEATRRSRDTVLANISHEFRTPLSAQLASIELLRERLPEIEPREVRELVLALERGTLRLTHLIDNLLESVRIESGADSIRRRPVALDEVVEAAVDLTSPLAALREQTIQVDLPYPLPGVSGDAPRLVQVFVNLIANANKFAPEKTSIRVGGEVREGEVVLWVEDEGPGLSGSAALPRFERFHRSPGEEPEESGMGLGLFIVKSIVERHGGRVEVQGRSGGLDAARGTRMCVVLPAGESA